MVDLKTHTEITLKLARATEGSELRLAEAAAQWPPVGIPEGTNPVLLSGSDRWETYMRVGISPLSLPRTRTPCPYTAGKGSHPILLAAALQDSEPALSDEFLHRVDLDVAFYHENAGKPNHQGVQWWYTGSMSRSGKELRPERPRGEFRCKTSLDLMFSPSHAEWYSYEALTPRMEQEVVAYRAASLLQRLTDSLGHEPSGLLRVRNLATKFLHKAIQGRAKPQAYRDLARCVRFCHQDALAKLLFDDKDYNTGALTLLLAFLRESTEEQMARGLKQLVKSSFLEGLALLPRAPTIRELRKLNGKDVQQILLELPWEFLEEMLNEDAAGVRGLLIKNIDDLGQMQRCVENHARRPKRSYTIITEEAPPEAWGDYKEKIVSGYAGARAYREAVELLDVPLPVATHLLMAHWTCHEHHKPALEWLKEFPDLEKPLFACPSPFEIRDPGSYRHLELEAFKG